MKIMNLGKTEIKISKMGLGTWAIGGGPAWGKDKELNTCVDTIVTAVSQGMNMIDTAPAYNFGNSEKIVGEALKHLNRNEIVLVTKCGIVWNRKGSLFNKVGETQLYKNLTRESIREEVEESLKRLKTDYIDVYMTHWQSVEPCFTPVSETMEALNELKAEGKIKAIGAANVTTEHIREYLKYGQLDIVQGKYSILDRQIEEELLPVCKEHQITLQAYSPLEQGLLSGKFKKDYNPSPARANKKWFQKDNMEKAIDMMEKWKPLCEKYHCSVANLALAWVMAQGTCINLLSGATSVEQVMENIRASEIELSLADCLEMRALAESLDI